MRITSWGEADVLRVVAVGGATAAVIVVLLVAKPFYSRPTTAAPDAAKAIEATGGLRSATEPVSFVTSPTVDTNVGFFVGNGDGSAGYFEERPDPRAKR
jgi:hypothetical protein